MEIIVHRVNKIRELKKIPKEYGVEIDVRDFNKNLVIQHDPFKNGVFLEKYLKNYKHGTLIINVKSEGIEFKIIKLLRKFKIRKFFFLDSSYPLIINMMKKNIKNISVRVSDYESFNNVEMLKNKFKWLWLEIFNNFKISKKQINYINNNSLKICLVSPELHGRAKDIKKIKRFICKKKIKLSAVCTKIEYIKYWST
jgi:hypothetical protein